MNETRLERAINKNQPLFTLLLVKSNTSEEVKPLHPLAQSLLREFENVFPNDLPPGLLSLREIEHQIDILLDAPSPSKSYDRCNPH